MAIPEQHRAWFLDICKHIGLEGKDAEQAFNDNGFILNGVKSFLFSGSLLDGGNTLLIHSVIGELPEEINLKIEIMIRCLTYQWIVAGSHSASIGLDSESGILVLVQSISPEKVAPEAVPAILDMLAQSIEAFCSNVLLPKDATLNAGTSELDQSVLLAQEHQKRAILNMGL